MTKAGLESGAEGLGPAVHLSSGGAAEAADATVRITVVRHGKPDIDDSWMEAAGFDAFWEAYDAAGITSASHPSEALRRVLADCDLLVTSTLPRAQESLARILPDSRPRIDERFREIGIPSVSVPWLQLPGTAWSAVGRLAWLARLARANESVESVGRATHRVRGAARLLTEWSERHAHIGIVTHGFFNSWLCTELRRLGWQGAYLGTPRHWSWSTLTRRALPGDSH